MIPSELKCETREDKVRFSHEGVSTGWMSRDDGFIRRIDEDSLNKKRISEHLLKEIEIRNTLDRGVRLLEDEKYPKAIGLFDEVLFYDSEYGEALLYKSYSLRGQKHFVKALRHYRRAVKASDELSDAGYYRTLLSEANAERDSFPKLKLNIYTGDEFFAKGEFEKAVKSYDRALMNPSKFKDKILSKLLNKKATALVKLERFDDALKCFEKSLEVGSNDYAVFGEGLCRHSLALPLKDKFKTRLDVSKRQMLRQANTLNAEGFYDDAKLICEFLCQNHFAEDEFYSKLKKAYKISLRK